MNTFGLNVIASDKDFYHGRGKSISLPAKDGAITILAHHADCLLYTSWEETDVEKPLF